MPTETKMSLSGAAALAVGVFVPVISMPFVGSLNLFANGKGDGILLLPLAVLVAAFAFWRKHLAGLVTGGLTALFVAYKFVRVLELVEADESSPFMAGTVQIQWGWLLLVAGAILAVVGPIVADRKARRAGETSSAPPTLLSPDLPRPAATAAKKMAGLAIGGVAIVLSMAVGYSLAPGETRRTDSMEARSTSEAGNAERREVSPSSPSAAVAPAAKTVPSAEPASDPFPHFGDGTHVVGTDIVAGTYRTREAAEGCYWERLSGFGGSDILANEFTELPTIVTISATDAGFRSTGCGTWTQDLSAITTSRESFGDGAFIVGTDIAPGTYRGSGGESCYWERLSSFEGDGITLNGLESGAAVVTIAESDKGFRSRDCAPWTRLRPASTPAS